MDMGGWINWDGIDADVQAAVLRMPATEREDLRQLHNECEQQEEHRRDQWQSWWSQDRPGLAKVLERLSLLLVASTPVPYAVEMSGFGYGTGDLAWEIENAIRSGYLDDDPELDSAIQAANRLQTLGGLWVPVIADVVALVEQAYMSTASQVRSVCADWQLLEDVAETYVLDVSGELMASYEMGSMAAELTEIVQDMIRQVHPVLLMPKPNLSATSIKLIHQPLPRRQVDALDAAVRAAALVVTVRANPEWGRFPECVQAAELLIGPWQSAMTQPPAPEPVAKRQSAGTVVKGPWEHGAA